MKILQLLLLSLHLCRVSSQNFQHLKDVIKLLNRLYNYETITIFISEELLPDTDDLFPLLESEEESSMKPKIIISKNFSSRTKIERILNGSPLSLVLVDSHESYILDLVTAQLRGIRRNPIIFYVQYAPDEMETNLKQFCQWTATTQFINSLVLFNSSRRRYGCEMYPYVEVVDQTEWSPFDLLANSPKALDFKGKAIKVPVTEDKPRIFARAYDLVTKQLKLSGICWKLFKNYVQHSNGKVHPYLLYEPGERYRSIDEILDMVENRSVICSPNCFAGLNLERFSTSHPIQMVDWCFMVPVIGEVPSYEYILTPFQNETRLILSVAIIATGIMFWILGGRKSFSLGLLNSLCGYISLGFCTNVDGLHKWTSRFVQAMIRVAGFIFSNYYNTLLASFLATTLFGKQIDTIIELIESNLEIMLRSEDYNALLPFNLPKNFLKNLKINRRNVVSELRNHLNNSYGYIITSDRWDYHKFQQESMKVHKLRFTDICYAQYLLTFPLWYDNMFTESLNHFILRSIQGGLVSYWTEQSYRDFRKIGAVNETYIPNEAIPMDVVFFTYAWLCLLIGLGSSSVIFVLEVKICLRLG